MGLNLLTGYNGQVSIGHGAFFGVGAFTSAMLDHATTTGSSSRRCRLPRWSLARVGLVVGFPALRVKGLYLALVTLGLGGGVPRPRAEVRRDRRAEPGAVGARDLAPPSWWPQRVFRAPRVRVLLDADHVAVAAS